MTIAEPEMDDKLLEVHNLRKWFPIHKGILGRLVGNVKAVDGVNFFIREGETLGLVGRVVAARRRPAAACCAPTIQQAARSGSRIAARAS